MLPKLYWPASTTGWNFYRTALRTLRPQKLLKRGYSITLKDGKAVKSAACLQSGDELITRLYEGEVKSRVE